MIAIAVLLFVTTVLVVAGYAFVRPFTHTHHRHPTTSMWRPLD